MPLFYLDMFLGSQLNLNDEGHDLGSLRAAEIEAMRTAGELARERLFTVREAGSEDIRVEVKDEHRQPVLTVTLSIRVDRARQESR